MSNFTIRPLTPDDRPWVTRWLDERWGAPRIVTRGVLHEVDELSGFAVEYTGPEPAGERGVQTGEIAGLITYVINHRQCEIITLDTLVEGLGIGTALVESVIETARGAGCTRLWLITTNDNTPALRFYQRRGFYLAALHRGAVELDRRIKPEIPMIGLDDIPIRDEIELEMWLD